MYPGTFSVVNYSTPYEVLRRYKMGGAALHFQRLQLILWWIDDAISTEY